MFPFFILGVPNDDASYVVVDKPKPECIACGVAVVAASVSPKLNVLAGVAVAVVPNPLKPVCLACCC